MTIKNTKSALLTAVLALALCISMLIGTTFAWFTDNVVSKNNIITAGNLDIELEYAVDYDTTTMKPIWNTVDANASLFDREALWEPGHTEIVALRVKNVGSLALKYDLEVEVFDETGSVNVYGDKFLLSKYLKYGADVMDVNDAAAEIRTTAYLYDGMRATAASLATNNFGTATIGTDKVLKAGEGQICLLAVTMPTTVGNEANYKKGAAVPTIDFGVNLLATQHTAEEDTFGNDYDAEATYPELPTANITELGKKTVAANEWNTSYSMIRNDLELDAAYLFKTTETYEQAQSNPYRYWHADYVVSFDRDVAPTTDLGIAGQYGSWGWIGFTADIAEQIGGIKAGEEYRLLQIYNLSMNYENLCLLVEEFTCGAFDNGANKGTTMTVELRLYETKPSDPSSGVATHNDETGVYRTINTIKHTFN